MAKCGRSADVEVCEAKYGILVVSTVYWVEFTVTVIMLLSLAGVAILTSVDAVIEWISAFHAQGSRP